MLLFVVCVCCFRRERERESPGGGGGGGLSEDFCFNCSYVYIYINLIDWKVLLLPLLANSTNPKFDLDIDGAIGELEAPKENNSKKRGRSESCGQSSSKACKEKLRRDRLNDKFVELASILEPGRTPKTDKAAILVDAVRMVIQLRGEAQKLKDLNSGLHEKIKELKAEKTELRNEKQMLKSEKDRLEQQLKTANVQPGYLAPPAIPAAFGAQGQALGNKLVPVISYPGVAMWQFMPPASVDTSHDHVLRPPVA